MAKYKDTNQSSDDIASDDLSMLYQASKIDANDKGDVDIPSEIDARILQAAKTSVTEPPANVSYLRRHWEIPASVAASIMFGTLILLNTHHGPPTVFDESNTPTTISIDTEQKETLSATEGSSSQVELKAPMAFEEAERSEADISGSANAATQYTTKSMAKKKISEKAKLKQLGSTLKHEAKRQRMEAAAPLLSDSNTDLVKEQKLQSKPTTQAGLAELKQPFANKAPAENSAESTLSEKDWLKYIDQLLNNKKIDAANKQLKGFKAIYPDYDLKDFCRLHIALTSCAQK